MEYAYEQLEELEKGMKKCPFCGSRAHIRYIAVMERPYFPECVDEKCIAGDTGISFETKEEAIEAWNRRA